MNDRTTKGLDRRAFFGIGAAATASLFVPGMAQASPRPSPAPKVPERVLSFFNTHTGERLKTAYCCGGQYQPDALREVNHILRDFRANEVKPIEPKLLDLLYELGGTLETDQPFHIISGYRSPSTNNLLRERGGCDDRRRDAQPAHGRPGDRHSRAGCEARSAARGRAVPQDRRRRLLSRPELRPRRRRARSHLVATRPAAPSVRSGVPRFHCQRSFQTTVASALAGHVGLNHSR